MNLRTRIVAALVLAALIPMAVVLAIPLVQAEKRAHEETGRRMDHAREQAEALLENERSAVRSAADGAAKALKTDRNDLAAILRGPESVARPVAAALAAHRGLDRVEILGSSGVTLAVFESPGSGAGADAVLVER